MRSNKEWDTDYTKKISLLCFYVYKFLKMKKTCLKLEDSIILRSPVEKGLSDKEKEDFNMDIQIRLKLVEMIDYIYVLKDPKKEVDWRSEVLENNNQDEEDQIANKIYDEIKVDSIPQRERLSDNLLFREVQTFIDLNDAKEALNDNIKASQKQ